MAAPFWKADPRVWPLIAEGLAKPWPAEVACEDLRWWVDQIGMGRVRSLPGRPTLGARWGWKDCAVRKLLAEVDPLGQRDARQPDASATPAPRQPDASRTPAAERVEADNHDESASRTPAPRQPDASATPAGRHTRVVDRATEQTEQTDVHAPPADPLPAIREPVLVSPVERPPVADDWTQLRDHFDTFPWTRAPRDRKKGAGIQLVKLLDACDGDLQTAKTVLDWWAWADTPRARQLRTGDSRGSESDAAPVYGLTTLTTDKNAHEYITQALSWARQRNPPRRKLSTATERPTGRAAPIVETPDHVIKPVRLQPLPPPLKPRKP